MRGEGGGLACGFDLINYVYYIRTSVLELVTKYVALFHTSSVLHVREAYTVNPILV